MSEVPRRVFVLGLCRDCAATLPPFLAMVKDIVTDGRLEVQVLLGENGSTDGTRDIIEQSATANSWLQLVDTSFMSEVPERLKRMATGREVLRKSLPPWQSGDVVLVADIDLNFVKPLSVDTLLDVLTELDQPMTIGICSYSVPIHYDILALRESLNSRNPALDSYLTTQRPRNFLSRLIGLPFRMLNAYKIAKKQRELGVASGREFISAFNGMCLYLRALYDQASYLAPGIDCEHVTLNVALHRKTNGVIRVSSYVGVLAPEEHIVSFTSVLRKFFWRALPFPSRR